MTVQLLPDWDDRVAWKKSAGALTSAEVLADEGHD